VDDETRDKVVASVKEVVEKISLNDGNPNAQQSKLGNYSSKAFLKLLVKALDNTRARTDQA